MANSVNTSDPPHCLIAVLSGTKLFAIQSVSELLLPMYEIVSKENKGIIIFYWYFEHKKGFQ